MIIVYN